MLRNHKFVCFECKKYKLISHQIFWFLGYRGQDQYYWGNQNSPREVFRKVELEVRQRLNCLATEVLSPQACPQYYDTELAGLLDPVDRDVQKSRVYSSRYEESYIVAVKTLYSEPGGITDGKVMASPAGWRTCFGVINTTVCRTQNGDPAPLDAFQPPDLAPGWIRIDRRREGLDAGRAEMIRAMPAPPPITDTAAQTLYKVFTADFTQFYGAQLYTNFGFQTFYTKFFRQKVDTKFETQN
ncbi:hypothetical protein DFH06DRAFT_1147153 [Mycena polygramma]|nr:hypothetical protein DFH06DRAFT_1147153 [Mycena polygramma]